MKWRKLVMSEQLTNLELLKDLDKDESLTDVSVEEQQHLFGGHWGYYRRHHHHHYGYHHGHYRRWH
ncbi:MAG: hypothetical protein C6Y22_16630 [Hapalosiphonaceae cyanobacterium JJU2]|nr:MAG: hypothetical protein C6Y22_16630 [Hapalosiphonaceae cyanobacterium JJU2]